MSLISLSFNTVSRCKTVTLVPSDPFDFFYWAPFIKLWESAQPESQYFVVLYSCTMAPLNTASDVLDTRWRHIKELDNRTELI